MNYIRCDVNAMLMVCVIFNFAEIKNDSLVNLTKFISKFCHLKLRKFTTSDLALIAYEQMNEPSGMLS